MPTLVLLALIAVPLHYYFATGPAHFGTTAAGFRAPPTSRGRVTSWADSNLMMARGLPNERPPAKPLRLPFASSDPLAKHRAITGINAHVRWYQRVRSLIGIAALVVLMGVLVAVSVGLAFFTARIILELLVG